MPDPKPETVRDFLASDDYVDTVQYLDLSKPHPLSLEHDTWLEYSAEELEDFSQNIDQILSQYGFAMDSDMVNTLQELSDSTLVNMLSGINNTNFVGIVNLLEQQTGAETNTYNLFADDDVGNHVDEYRILMIELIEYFEEDSQPNVHNIDTIDIYRDGQPEVGSARIDMPLEESNPAIDGSIDGP